MATTDQIQIGGDGLSGFVDRYKGDDWPFNFGFGADMSAYTWTADLITEPGGTYTVTAITGANGTVDASLAASGTISVTVADALTSTLTQDVDSVDLPASTQTTFLTRLRLRGTQSTNTKTYAVIPVRIIRA